MRPTILNGFGDRLIQDGDNMSLLIIIVLAASTTIPAIVMSRVLTGKWFSWTY